MKKCLLILLLGEFSLTQAIVSQSTEADLYKKIGEGKICEKIIQYKESIKLYLRSNIDYNKRLLELIDKELTLENIRKVMGIQSMYLWENERLNSIWSYPGPSPDKLYPKIFPPELIYESHKEFNILRENINRYYSKHEDAIYRNLWGEDRKKFDEMQDKTHKIKVPFLALDDFAKKLD